MFVAVDGGTGFPELFVVQAPAFCFGVADAPRDSCAAHIAVVAAGPDLAVLLGVLALRASASVTVVVKVGLIDA